MKHNSAAQLAYKEILKFGGVDVVLTALFIITVKEFIMCIVTLLILPETASINVSFFLMQSYTGNLAAYLTYTTNSIDSAIDSIEDTRGLAVATYPELVEVLLTQYGK